MGKAENKANALATLVETMQEIALSAVNKTKQFDIREAIVVSSSDDKIVVKIDRSEYSAKNISKSEVKKNDSVLVLSYSKGTMKKYIINKITKDEKVVETFSPFTWGKLRNGS